MTAFTHRYRTYTRQTGSTNTQYHAKIFPPKEAIKKRIIMLKKVINKWPYSLSTELRRTFFLDPNVMDKFCIESSPKSVLLTPMESYQSKSTLVVQHPSLDSLSLPVLFFPLHQACLELIQWQKYKCNTAELTILCINSHRSQRESVILESSD